MTIALYAAFYILGIMAVSLFLAAIGTRNEGLLIASPLFSLASAAFLALAHWW